jgi:hypothetical protein
MVGFRILYAKVNPDTFCTCPRSRFPWAPHLCSQRKNKENFSRMRKKNNYLHECLIFVSLHELRGNKYTWRYQVSAAKAWIKKHIYSKLFHLYDSEERIGK